MDLENRLIQFIEDDILVGQPNAAVQPEESLLTSGLLDSLSVMSLISFIEQDMGFDVSPVDVTVENFESVRTIAEYLRRTKELAQDA